ncbi:MAG: toll/interleukin-1 receptor domain-containing protein [Deltaproteobacteria bacterium]|nr:toll/interleukin-1 receptor domain-containing protein [Deltaproteobacteria bacterium]
MSRSDPQFSLPRKLDSYLSILNRRYERSGDVLLREVVVNGIVSVHEGWDYDNWNGGTYGHAITLTVSEDLYLKVIDVIDDVRNRITADLNKLDNSPNEHISEVFIETELSENDNWREQTGIYRPRMIAPAIAPEALSRIWGTEHIRLFLSHKSSIKENASQLKHAFARCGVAAFVAHEDIEPIEEWQREIERALFSMDALVALLSEDFHNSNWTDQEVGVAIGRGVPLIAVRLGKDPYGLMGKGQGLGVCDWSDPKNIAVKVFQLLHKRLSDKSRLFECALAAYAKSQSFDDSGWKVKHLLSVFDTLSADQVRRVVEAYRTNAQNKSSFRGMNLLQPLFEKWTGEHWVVRNNELKRAVEQTDMEIPF